MSTFEITLQPELAQDSDAIITAIRKKTGNPNLLLDQVILLRRSLDARGSKPIFRIQCSLDASRETVLPDTDIWPYVENADPIHIIGAGPCGYFAALECIRLGKKPVIFERGKDVQSRRRDLRAIQQESIVHPDSNYCFGEGGAGTYSDGKLYTRSQKRGNIQDVLGILVTHGASSEILLDAHPHIGSNKLPNIISNIRATIEKHGGEVHFEQRLTDIQVRNGAVHALEFNDKDTMGCNRLILATGHSARDIYYLFSQKGWHLEFKPFALGVRIEHPQALIDRIQYKCMHRGDFLPAASYSLTTQVEGAGVYSFCMCPGGVNCSIRNRTR